MGFTQWCGCKGSASPLNQPPLPPLCHHPGLQIRGGRRMVMRRVYMKQQGQVGLVPTLLIEGSVTHLIF